MKKRIIKIALITIFLVFVVGFLYTPAKKSIPKKLSTPIPESDVSDNLGVSLDSFSPPEENRLIISGVQMRNFYEDINDNNISGGNIKFVENNDYRFTYIYDLGIFTITILNPDFENTRTRAETNFLSSLEINQNQACKLTVQIQTPPFVNPEKSKDTYGLSFCE